MVRPADIERRNLIANTAIAGAAVAGSLILPPSLAAKGKKTTEKDEAEVTPPEDLMREHGVLDRLLLVYEAGLRKFASSEDFDPAIITAAAETVRDFIENYHEKSEEEAVFPRFRKAGKMVSLVDTLLASIRRAAASRRPSFSPLPAAARMATIEDGW